MEVLRLWDAAEAAQGQVGRNGPATMFLGNDVINLERGIIIILRHPTVLTAMSRSLPYLPYECRIHGRIRTIWMCSA
jgi:hypothetical protein